MNITRKFLSLVAGILATLTVRGQATDVFDIVTFTPPAGWKKETTAEAVSFVITNGQTGEWCRISILRSIASRGTPMADFTHDWNDLVGKPYAIGSQPTAATAEGDGWTAVSGASEFLWQGQNCLALLNTLSGYGVSVSITVLMRGRSYAPAAKEFLDSIDLRKPAGHQDSGTQVVSQLPTGGDGHGITRSTTTFNDGWTAQATSDGIVAINGTTRYKSFYGVPSFTTGGERGTTEYYWNKLVVPDYTITNLWLNPDVQGIGYFNYYAEGTGIEKSSGRSVFIGFRVVAENGVDYCTMATSPTRDEYLRHFPNLEMLKNMRGSNRFAITQEDIIGDWSSSDGSALQYYNVYTGQNAGMQFSQGGQEFFFKPTGDYRANVSGAMGTMGGPQVSFSNKYEGKFSVTDWEITLTGYGGVTQVFTAYFEALQGGRILHISKKDAPGVHYPLVKVK